MPTIQALVVLAKHLWSSLPASWQLIAFALTSYTICLIVNRTTIAYSRRKFCAENGCYPVTCRLPLKDKIFGLDFILELLVLFKEKRLLDAFSNYYYKEIGTTFSIQRGVNQTIFTIDPENIKTVLAVNFKDYGLGFRAPLFGPVVGRGIFAVDGDEWAFSRAMLRPSFAKDQVADIELIDKHISHLLDQIPRDTTVDLQKLFYRFTLDSGTEFLFGHSTDTLCNPSKQSQEFSDVFDFTLKDVAYQARLGPFRRFQWRRSAAKRAYQDCRSYVDRYVEQALDLRSRSIEGQPPQAPDMHGAHDSLLKHLAVSGADKNKIREELLSVLIAARDTTSNLLGNLFFVLARKPDIWTKVRAEVAHLDGVLPKYDQLRDLKYAKYCINESLRLHPPVPSNGRMAFRDTILPRGGGVNGEQPIHVPKGSMVNYTVYAMHRRTDLWGPDAEEFRPDRWSNRKPSWEFLPFNGGPRICIGQQYAITEALLVLVRFAQEFASIESKDTRPWTEEIALGCGSANGVMVSFKTSANI